MYTVLFCENVMSLSSLDECVGCHILKSINCIYMFWDMSYMQLLCCRNFIKSQV